MKTLYKKFLLLSCLFISNSIFTSETTQEEEPYFEVLYEWKPEFQKMTGEQQEAGLTQPEPTGLEPKKSYEYFKNYIESTKLDIEELDKQIVEKQDELDALLSVEGQVVEEAQINAMKTEIDNLISNQQAKSALLIQWQEKMAAALPTLLAEDAPVEEETTTTTTEETTTEPTASEPSTTEPTSPETEAPTEPTSPTEEPATEPTEPTTEPTTEEAPTEPTTEETTTEETTTTEPTTEPTTEEAPTEPTTEETTTTEPTTTEEPKTEEPSTTAPTTGGEAAPTEGTETTGGTEAQTSP